MNAKISEKVRYWSKASIYDKSTWVYSTCVDEFGGNVARLADALKVHTASLCKYFNIGNVADTNLSFWALVHQCKTNDQIAMGYLAQAVLKAKTPYRLRKVEQALDELSLKIKQGDLRSLRSSARRIWLYSQGKCNVIDDDPTPATTISCDFYVYIARDHNDIIRYVGKGSGSRLEHVNSGASHNRRLNQYYFANGPMKVAVTRNNLCEKEALEIEVALICEHRDTIWNSAKPWDSH